MKRRRRLGEVAGGITAANFAVSATAMVTGPLQARALEPAGRGELAAVLVTLSLVPLLADLGLSTFVTREAARGRPLSELIGSVVSLSVGMGVLVGLAGPLIAHAVAGGRHTVDLLIIVGLATMPLTLGFNALNNINWALQRWRIWLWVRMVPAFGGLIVTVTLFVADRLTVTTAALTSVALSLLASLPLLSILREAGRPQWNGALAKAGLKFGARAWVSSIANLSNARLDQLLMARLVSAPQLGLYAVAVNTTALQTGLSTGLVSAIFPRIATGDAALAMRATRVTLLITAATGAVIAAVVGVILGVVFGDEFTAAATMARILLAAAVPAAGFIVLATALTASGHPGVAARAQLIGLVITVPGLLLLLGPLGAEGAAVVSLGAYSAAFAFALWRATEFLGGRKRDYLLPHREDWTLLTRLSGLARGRRAAG
jgi:O-antigen/teichoic acid export membrane protein